MSLNYIYRDKSPRQIPQHNTNSGVQIRNLLFEDYKVSRLRQYQNNDGTMISLIPLISFQFTAGYLRSNSLFVIFV